MPPTTVISTANQIINEYDLVGKLQQLFLQARDKKRNLYETWRRNYLLVNARMWADVRPIWMPNPVSSEIMPIISSLVAWMMDQNIDFSVSPAAAPHDPYYDMIGKISNDLETVLETNWAVLQWDRPVSLILWDAAMYGAGILKATWDTGSDDGLGNAMLERIDPYNFYPDPNCGSLDDMQYSVEIKRLSFQQIQRQYPLAYDRVLDNLTAMLAGGGAASGSGDVARPEAYENARYPIANPGAIPGGVNVFGETTQSGSGAYGLPGQSRIPALLQQGIDVYEYWLRENFVSEPTTTSGDTDPVSVMGEAPVISDKWRVVVIAAGVVLMDELAEDLWEYSRHPYSRFCYDDIGEFWGISLVSHLSSPQIAVNRLLGSLQQNAELCGNPIFIDPANSGIARTRIINRPGQRLTTSSSASGNNNDPHWLVPPNMPQYMQQLIDFWISRMENISGLASVTKGQSPPPRTTGATVSSVQEAGFVRVRQWLRNLEHCLDTCGWLVSQLIIQNYTVPRTISIIGDQGTQSALKLAANHFYAPTWQRDEDKGDGSYKLQQAPLRFALIISCGANNPTSRAARIAEADTLFAMKAIDGQAVLEAHNYSNWPAILQRMKETARDDAINAAISGQPGGSGASSRVRAGRKT